jgi:SAM-dependent methyltransferase
MTEPAIDPPEQNVAAAKGVATWCAAGTAKPATCPVCGAVGDKRALLKTESLVPGRGQITLLACAACINLFWDDLEPFAYEGGSGYPWSNDFYVEQGAGIDALIEPIARLVMTRVARYLEIGCGYGFSVDAAQRLFGWRGLGLDPSPLAQAGRDGLDLDIQPIYATTEIDLGGRFDLVYASEVIEHVGDPKAFIEICAAHLGADGILVLTTPDAGSIRPDIPMAELLLALSPGHHLILYSAEGLRHLLQLAGFAHVSVDSRGHRLVAYASKRPIDFDATAPLDRALYRRYLDQVLARENLPISLQRGLRYRLLKELTNAAEHDAARALLNILSADIERSFGFALDAPLPDRILDQIRSGTTSGRFGAPWCLPGILYCAGMIAQNGDGDLATASRLFDQAARAATAFRRSYVEIGIDDGETSVIEQDAPGQALLALCRADPGAVVARLGEAAWDAPPAWTERIVLCLLDLGHLEQAVDAAAAFPALRALAAGFTALHRRGDGKAALASFEIAIRAGGLVGQRARAGVPAATHQAILKADAGEVDDLLTPLCSAIDPYPAAVLAPIMVSLTDRGLLDAAARLEPMVRGLSDWRVTTAVGMLALLHHKRPVSAGEAFATAWTESLSEAAGSRDVERARIKYHEVLARLIAGDGQGAAAAAADLLGPAAPDWVSDAAKEDLRALLADHPDVSAALRKLQAA